MGIVVQPAAERLAGRQGHEYAYDVRPRLIVQPAAERLAGRQRHEYAYDVPRSLVVQPAAPRSLVRATENNMLRHLVNEFAQFLPRAVHARTSKYSLSHFHDCT